MISVSIGPFKYLLSVGPNDGFSGPASRRAVASIGLLALGPDEVLGDVAIIDHQTRKATQPRRRTLCLCDLANFAVGENALLEYLPDEVIPFANSRIERTTRIELHATSRLFASDVISAGRVSYGAGELFAFACMRSQFELHIDGRLVVLYRLLAREPADVAALGRLCDGRAHLVLAAAYAADLPPSLVGEVQQCEAFGELCEAGATLIDGVIFVRALAQHVWQAHEAVYQIWATVRPAVCEKPGRRIRKP